MFAIWKHNQSTFPLPIGQETFHVNHLHPPNVKLGYTVCDVHNFWLTFAKYNNLFIYFKKMQTSIRSIGRQTVTVVKLTLVLINFHTCLKSAS